jgi:hypothetical protein
VNPKQWLQATDPHGGLYYLCGEKVRANRSKAGRRKLRLFLCACARRVWDLIPGSCRRAVELGERLCEGENGAVRSAAPGARPMTGPLECRHAADAAQACAETNIRWAADVGAHAAAMATAWAHVRAEDGTDMRPYAAAKAAEQRVQAELLREIFGNPFRPVKFHPDWRTDTAVALARQMYDARDFSSMPILGDALQDAGCSNEVVLNHCRDTSALHVRGCWVADLVLGLDGSSA